MVEGISVFKEAISFLKSLKPLSPLKWDNNLFKSANEHVNDIGPKGLLLYQSSDGTEPEDRITKYGNYDILGENIDFGPNDAIGVIISLTLDDGEEERPHRENLFKSDYNKVGIACGIHKTEFQMCVMDFAGEGQNEMNNNKNDDNNNYNQNYNNQNYNNQNYNNQNYNNQNYNQNYNKQNNNNQNNQSPLVKLSLENDEMKNNINNQAMLVSNNNVVGNNGNIVYGKPNDIVGQCVFDTLNALNNMKVISKKVEINTKITYTYEDGSTRNVNSVEVHEFK